MSTLAFILMVLAAQMPMGGVTVSPAGLSHNAFTSFTLGSDRSNFTGCVGFRFQAPSSSPPTITGLCRWNKSGNTQTHTVYLEDGTGVKASASINTTLGTPGTNQCVAITPFTLVASTFYYIGSSETSGGDHWYDNDTSGTWDSAYGSQLGDIVITCNGASSGAGNTVNHSYVPVNMTRQ